MDEGRVETNILLTLFNLVQLSFFILFSLLHFLLFSFTMYTFLSFVHSFPSIETSSAYLHYEMFLECLFHFMITAVIESMFLVAMKMVVLHTETSRFPSLQQPVKFWRKVRHGKQHLMGGGVRAKCLNHYTLPTALQLSHAKKREITRVTDICQ